MPVWNPPRNVRHPTQKIVSKTVALMGYPLGLPWQVVSRPSRIAREYPLMELEGRSEKGVVF